MGSRTATIMAEVRASNEKALECRQKPASSKKRVEPYSYVLGTGESHAGPKMQPSRYTGEGALAGDYEAEATRLTGLSVIGSDDNVIGALPSAIPMAKALEFLRGFPVFASVSENVLRQIVTASGVNSRVIGRGRFPHKVTEVFGPIAGPRKGSGVLTGVKVPVIWCTCKGLEGRFCLQHDKSKGRSNVRSV